MSRKTDLAKIHIAKKDLGLDDDTYRHMLQEVAGVTSSAELSERGLAKVLAHLRGLGWKPKGASKLGRRPSPPESKEALIKKIEAQLLAGGLTWAYADGMARRMFKVEKVEWLPADQLGKIIAALNYSAMRKRKSSNA